MTLEILQRIISGEAPGAPVADLIGMRMVAAELGRVTFELDAGPEHSSPPGTLHGGILCDLADGAMGCATSRGSKRESFATVELKINFLKPVWTGRLTAVGEVIKAGGRWRSSMPDHRRLGSLVAYATSTCMTLREGED